MIASVRPSLTFNVPLFLFALVVALDVSNRNKPPASLKIKGLYMRRDVARMARHHGAPLVPLKDPRAMYDTLSAQRYALVHRFPVGGTLFLSGIVRYDTVESAAATRFCMNVPAPFEP